MLKQDVFRFEDVIWVVVGLRMSTLRDPARFGPVRMPIDEALMQSVSL